MLPIFVENIKMAGVEKRTIRWTMPLLIAVCLLSSNTQAKYGGGSGTAEDPYLIYTAEQMNTIGTSQGDWDNHFKLMADIDLSGYDGKEGRSSFNMVGTDWNTPFIGVFDGNGHTISHLTMQGEGPLGLFGLLTRGAEIKNLGVVDVKISGSSYNVGGLVGRNALGKVIHCYSTGMVKGEANVGGLIGINDNGNVAYCYNTGTVAGKERVGGVVGTNYSGALIHCYNTGDVSGNVGVGGLVGNNRGSSNQCFNTGMISGNERIGGLVGYNQGAMTQCYSIGAVSGNTDIGGLVGNDNGSVNQCYSVGAVSGNKLAGGLVGRGGTATKCFWDIQNSGQATSAGGMGLITNQMQDIQTYLDAGWDWVGEIENGTSQIWQMPEGEGYPVLAVFNGYVPPQLQGDGTSEHPYLISNFRELGAIAHYNSSAHYQLTTSIDLADIVWGTAVIPSFAGTFNGAGLMILNLTIEGGDYLGLFGQLLSGAQVKNLGILDVSVNSFGEYVGGLAGYNRGAVVVNCNSKGAIRGSEAVGVLAGANSGIISNCYTEGTVTGDKYIGGLAGRNGHCQSGPCGGSISNCYSVSLATGVESVGGLVGSNDFGVINDCFWDIETSGQLTSASGTGKSTSEMQIAGTFLDAGWDFMDETTNGTEEIWWILEGQDYPKLIWELPADLWLRPLPAFCPDPQDAAIDIIHSPVMYWAPVNSTIQHDIYLGEDKQTVANATTLSLRIYRGRLPGDVASYDPGILEWGKTYYWRIDEYHTDSIISKGYVWSFTTADFLIVDDFESYNDLDPEDPNSNRIFLTWIDGYDNPWTNGAVVGMAMPPFVERTIAHTGTESMSFSYNNGVGKSEATAEVDNLTIGSDWTIEGVGILSLWFIGLPSNSLETMYVILNDTTGVNHDNPNATQVDVWTEWRIYLQEFADQGVDLTNVNSITLGFGNRNNPVAGGSGWMYFDDIRLYRSSP